MSLAEYFEKLIQRVEDSEEITNQDKDKNGFFRPTRTILLTHLNKLKEMLQK